jgi:inhibitor of KinA sporulation pathway (predicted exonuclease)
MLEKLGLSFDGRRHSGLDDSINIARIALELIKVCFFRVNADFNNDCLGSLCFITK